MNIASIQQGESLEALAKRVYSFKGQPNAARLKAAVDALSATNPALRRLSELDPGTRLVVPPIPDAEPSKHTQTFDSASTAAVVETLRFVIGQATTALSADIEQDLAATAQSVSVLRLNAFKKAAADAGDDGAALRSRLDAAAKERTKAAKELQTYHKRVLVRIDEDLGQMQTLLGG